MLISPAEPLMLRKLGKVSSAPEKYGSDFLFPSELGLIGVQRKEVKDFVSSCFDGRLAKELDQLKLVDQPLLILEGTLSWSTDGQMMGSWSSSYSKAMHLGTLFSVMAAGIWVLGSANMQDTSDCLYCLEKWMQKREHKGLSKPKLKATGQWGKATNRDWGIWLLQSFEGIGKGMAENIYDHFGGLPIQWTITEEMFRDVPGIGRGRARSLIDSLGDTGVEIERRTDS